MKKLLATISIITVLLLAVTTLGLAAEDSATVTVGWTVNARQSLYISSNGPNSTESAESVFNIPEPTDEDIQRGYIKKKNALRLVAVSNVAWEVQVRSENSVLGREDGFVKRISDLSIKGQGAYKQVSTSPTTIASGGPGEHEFGVDYKVNYGEDYKEGDYQANLVYTISVA